MWLFIYHAGWNWDFEMLVSEGRGDKARVRPRVLREKLPRSKVIKNQQITINSTLASPTGF